MSIARCCPYSDEKEECKYEKHWFHPSFNKCQTCERFLKQKGDYCENKNLRTYEKTLKSVKEGTIDLTTAKPDEKYHSLHEGYAILLEKVEDLKQQFDMLYNTGLPILWESTKTEDFDCAMLQLKAMLCNIQSLVEEATLAGVVVQKIQNTLDDTKILEDKPVMTEEKLRQNLIQNFRELRRRKLAKTPSDNPVCDNGEMSEENN